MFDVVIRGGSVIDGTGGPRRRADVGVTGGRVTAIGELGGESARRTIDADGLVVAPGFVDIHTHYDAQVFWDPACTPSPLHGVTTVVGGNCGFTIAPLAASEADYMMRMLARVEGMPVEALAAGVPWNWRTFGEYLDRIEGTLAVNAGFLVGHSALRRYVMRDRSIGEAATPADLAAMEAELRAALAAGGLGFSSSQAPTHNDAEGDPVPSRHATEAEILALCEVVRDYAGTTLEFIPTVNAFETEHMELMTQMSLRANRPLNWNVLATSAANRSSAYAKLAASDYARERGARVLALTVPDLMRIYLSFESGFLFDALPGWAKTMTAPHDEKLKLLADPAERQRLDDLAQGPENKVFSLITQWQNMTIAETAHPDNRRYQGRTVGDVAAEQGKKPFDAMLDVVLKDDLKTVLRPMTSGDDDESWQVRLEAWRDDRCILGASDAGAHLDFIATFNFTTAFLGNHVRDKGLMPLEEAIHRITDVQARLYGLTGRGRVEEGWQADLVVFDADTIAPEPVAMRHDLPGGAGRLYGGAEGIEHVFVNGAEIVRGKEVTDERPGTLLRSGRDTETVTVPGGRGRS
jgi:N-acyl-D-aspartate/D-glutamate deacylase